MRRVHAGTIVALTCALMAVACGEQAASTDNGETRPFVPDMMMGGDAEEMGRVDLGESSGVDQGEMRDLSGGLDMGDEDITVDEPDARPDQGEVQPEDMEAPAADMLLAREVERTDIVSMEREVPVYIPEDYDNARRIPLFVALHGFATSGSYIDNYLDLQELVATRDVIVAIPEGRRNLTLSRYWAATDGCCSNQSLERLEEDDVLFLRDVIEQAKGRYEISRVYVIGHSNGGFMSYRMACDAADLVDGVMSLAGATFDEETRCVPSEPVKILQVHGTLDAVIPFAGSGFRNIPGAEETVAYWAGYNGCDPDPDVREDDLDLVGGSRQESDVTHYSGCDEGADVTLWRIDGAGHSPLLHDDFMSDVLDYLEP